VYLRKRNATEENVATEVQRFKEERRRNVKQEEGEVQEVFSRVRASRPVAESHEGDEVIDDNEDDDVVDDDVDMFTSTSPARGQGRGSRRPSRGRGESSRRGGRGRGGRGRASSLVADDLSASMASMSRAPTARGGKNTRSIKDAFLMVQSSKRPKAHAVYV